MEIAAFIIAIAAGLAFLAGAVDRPRTTILVSVGLALLTAAWIVQSVVLSGTHVHIGP